MREWEVWVARQNISKQKATEGQGARVVHQASRATVLWSIGHDGVGTKQKQAGTCGISCP